MNWNREKTQYYVITALAVFITAGASAGPTFYKGSENSPTNSFSGFNSFGGRGSSWDGRNTGPQFPPSGWEFPTGGEFDRRPSRRGDWGSDFQFSDRDWNDREHCGDWDGQMATVPAPGSILLASVGLSVVGLIRKRTIG